MVDLESTCRSGAAASRGVTSAPSSCTQLGDRTRDSRLETNSATAVGDDLVVTITDLDEVARRNVELLGLHFHGHRMVALLIVGR